MKTKKIKQFGLLAILLLGTASANAATFYVSASGSDSNDGKSAELSLATIARAVALAANGDDICVTGTVAQTATVTISGKQLTIVGTGAEPLATIVDGQGAAQLFSLKSGASVTLRNLTLRGGNAEKQGGAVSVDHSTLSVEQCEIYGNQTAANADCQGGALFVTGGTLRLSETSLYGNTSYQGGALYALNSTVSAGNTTFEQNKTWFDDASVEKPSEARGGGMMLTNCTADFEYCTWHNNTSMGDGGGLCILTNAEGKSLQWMAAPSWQTLQATTPSLVACTAEASCIWSTSHSRQASAARPLP